MIALATNILVYARRQETAHLLARLAQGDERWGIPGLDHSRFRGLRWRQPLE